MRNWLDIGKAAIFRDKSKNGSFFLFLKEYKEQFGGSTSPSCNKCLSRYWNNYINSLIMSTENSNEYVLKLKYNNIFLGNVGPFRNGEFTKEQGDLLLKKHPHGANLFEKMPKVEKIEVKAEVIKPTQEVQKKKRPRTNKK